MMINEVLFPIVVSVITGVTSSVISLIIITKTETFKNKLKRGEHKFQLEYEHWSVARKKSAEMCYRIINTLKRLNSTHQEEYLTTLEKLLHDFREHLYETVDTLTMNSAFLKLHDFKNTFENIVEIFSLNHQLDWDCRFELCRNKIDKLNQIYNSWRDQIDFKDKELFR